MCYNREVNLSLFHDNPSSLHFAARFAAFVQTTAQHEEIRMRESHHSAGDRINSRRERILRKTYLDRDEARRDIFDYIEILYNPKRRHGYANDVSSIEYEKRYLNRLTSV